MAQLVVRLPGKHEVVGSKPWWCVTFSGENIQVLSGRLVYIFSVSLLVSYCREVSERNIKHASRRRNVRDI